LGRELERCQKVHHGEESTIRDRKPEGKYDRVAPPLPHPSWRHELPAEREKPRRLTAKEFWDRLGL
jgi:hypothetical protein